MLGVGKTLQDLDRYVRESKKGGSGGGGVRTLVVDLGGKR